MSTGDRWKPEVAIVVGGGVFVLERAGGPGPEQRLGFREALQRGQGDADLGPRTDGIAVMNMNLR